MVRRRILALTAVLTVAFGLCGNADARHIYKSVGPDGRVTYSDRPPPAVDGGHTETLVIPSDPANYPPPESAPPAAPLPGAGGTAIPTDPGNAAAAIAPGSDGGTGDANAAGIAPGSGSGGGVGGASGGGGGGAGGGGSSGSGGASSSGGGAAPTADSPAAPASSPSPVAVPSPSGPTESTRSDLGTATDSPPPVATRDASPDQVPTDQTSSLDSRSADSTLSPQSPSPQPANPPVAQPSPPSVSPQAVPPGPDAAQCSSPISPPFNPAAISYEGFVLMPFEVGLSYAMGAMAYRPDGDVGTDDPDGFGGSLLIAGSERSFRVFEISIPAPSMERNSRARLLRSGRVESGQCSDLSRPILGGLLVDDDAIYWTCRAFYNVTPQSQARTGRVSINFTGATAVDSIGSVPSSQHSNRWAGYLTRIPRPWCDEFTPGMCYGAGLSGVPGRGSGSQAPALFAWNAPAPERIQVLLNYPYNSADEMPMEYSLGDRWHSGSWVRTTAGEAFIAGGRIGGVGRAQDDKCCYGNPDTCALRLGVSSTAEQNKTYHCDPYFAKLRLHRSADMATVVTGEVPPHRVLPYAELDITRILEEQSSNHNYEITGMATDGLRLFVLQKNADSFSHRYDRYPIVHVFKLPGERCD